MKNILVIHQSAELYGSDRTLLLLLKSLNKKLRLTVILPSEGPLKSELEAQHIHVIVAPVLKLYRNMFKPANLLNFFTELRQAFKLLDSLNAEYRFDLIYSNTLAVLLGYFYARRRAIPHLWHIHEIIERPAIFKSVFIKLLSSSSTSQIVYNSVATGNFWGINAQLQAKGQVVWNGLEQDEHTVSEGEKADFRVGRINAGQEDIIIALVGRISRWKGQMLLLEAFKAITKDYPNVKLLFAGSPPPNQDVFLHNLENKISEWKLESKVTILPFTTDIRTVWQSIDIAVVPSTEPEPFGMVAIEAMSCQKPVVASNHGGITEIVMNNETGYLFQPGNALDLARYLEILINDPEKRKEFGKKGQQRVQEVFSLEQHVQKFETIFNAMIK